MSYIFNEFSTTSAGGPSFSSIGRVAREPGYRVAWFSHIDTYTCADTKLSNVPKEPHLADDLNGSSDNNNDDGLGGIVLPSL